MISRLWLAMLVLVLGVGQPARPTAPTIRGPREVLGTHAVYRLGGRGLTRFRCGVDRSPLSVCARRWRVTLTPGVHALRVRGIDARGRSGGVARLDVAAERLRAPAEAIEIGHAPYGVDYGAGALWVANADGTVTRVDPVRSTAVATIPVGTSASATAATEGAVWVGDYSTPFLSRIDPGLNRVVARVDVGGPPAGPAVAPDGSVWVSSFDGAVERVDPADSRLTLRVALGGRGELTHAGFGRIWSTNQNGEVFALDPADGRVVGHIDVSPDVDGIAITHDAVWVCTLNRGIVAAIQPRTLELLVRSALPGTCGGLVVAGDELWATLTNRGVAVRIDTATGRAVERVPVGSLPGALTSNGTSVWVADAGSSQLSRFSTSGSPSRSALRRVRRRAASVIG